MGLILHSAKLSFSVNGHPVGFKSCKRGVHQGDPLSPLLFCQVEEVQSRGISMLLYSGKLKPMAGPRGFSTPTHSLFPDDILVFCKGSKRNVEAIMSLFHEYGSVSGQNLSIGKCKFYANSISVPRLRGLSNLLGSSHGSLPFTYLGVPLFRGKPKAIHLQPLMNKIKAKLFSWKRTLLSIMGHVQLVKSIRDSCHACL